MATATKSTDEKDAEKAKADEQKTLEAQQAADAEAEAARLAANSRSASEAEAAATAELAVQKQQQAQQDLKDEAKDGSEEFGGGFYSTDNFSAVTRESFGRQVVEIKPAGWVGEGFIVAGSRIDELKDLIGKIKNLPTQEKKASKK